MAKWHVFVCAPVLLASLAACGDDTGGGAEGQAGAGESDPQPSEAQVDLGDTEQAVFDAVNAARADLGLGPYRADTVLLCAARRHAADVGPARRCDHTGADGSSFADRARGCGGRARAEIIACGQRSAEAAVEGWLGSRAGHREAVLSSEYTEIGLAMENNFWVGVLR